MPYAPSMQERNEAYRQQTDHSEMNSTSRPELDSCIATSFTLYTPTYCFHVYFPMASVSDQEASKRAGRLRAFLRDAISGARTIQSSQNAQLFLEAVRNQSPPTTCIETIVSSKCGLDSIRTAVRADLSPSFIISSTLPLLEYLSDPGIKALVTGQMLQKILVAIAKPSTVWNAIVNLFDNQQIPDTHIRPFAWLSLELISLPPSCDVNVLENVQEIADRKAFLKAQDHGTREIGYNIKKVLQIRSSPNSIQVGGPGGRHDNDHVNFRDISIYPTTDEFLSTQPPFYQTSKEVFDADLNDRARLHLDNQYRLLREDMLAELREELQVAMGMKKGKRTSVPLGILVPMRLDVGDTSVKGRLKKCTLLAECSAGLPFPKKFEDPSARKKYLKDHPSILKHQSFGVLTRDKEILGFAFLDRDNELLALSPPIISLQFTDSIGLRNALLALILPNADCVKFILVNTPVFGYEPVLIGLKGITHLSLQELLVNPTASDVSFEVPSNLRELVTKIERASQGLEKDGVVCLPDLQSKSDRSMDKMLGESPTQVRVDASQLNSLVHALKSPLTIIQGPPGTGKSFIGAQIAKCLYHGKQRILVISYTNHALDQFLEDLIDVGIESKKMVRIGSKAKSTIRTSPLLLSAQTGNYKRSKEAWNMINRLKGDASGSADELEKAFKAYRQFHIQWDDISEYLEFSEEQFYEALHVPDDNSDNWHLAGTRGKRIKPEYLFQRWIKGENAGILSRQISPSSRSIWDMPRSVRQDHFKRWEKSMIEERLETIQELVRQFNDTEEELRIQFNEADAHIVRQKQIIGCTTTAAAKYSRLIRAAEPDVVLVEEAGEILESHVLTALAPTVKQLILIGDHKQLRPKVNNYALTVEKGDGFDLNRSLFERLIIQGAAHTTLRKQHRMVPEISLFPRELTYPDLLDGPKTSGRPPIRGLQDRVIFVNHSKLEELDKAVKDRRDPSAQESKRNTFEASMVLPLVQFLLQQGYSTDQMVILAPYLGQVRLIDDLLRKNQYDPALSEMDKMDLIRHGLMTEAAAKVGKKPLRISTVDNYQGEESDIVIVSLTRSNESAGIGFMFAPERLNVLITRARNCLIMIGNMETFIRSKKGSATWNPFFDLLKAHNHLYDGFPVKCEKHPERSALIKEPIDFKKLCPDGGCTEPCNATLKCGIHQCKSRCHRITDHSQAECHQLIDKVCDRQHKSTVRCSRQNEGCHKCIKEDQEQERRIKRDLRLEEDRQRRQEEYTRRLQEIQDEIEHQRRINKYQAEEDDQKKTLEQQRADLATLKEREDRIRKKKQYQAQMAAQAQTQTRARSAAEGGSSKDQSQHGAVVSSGGSDDGGGFPDTAMAEWQHLKQYENANNKYLDELMGMIGLEDVKQAFLSIKSKVDTSLRQGISLDSERFSCSMLGNPGTGKTTAARLYAQFLTEVCVIPGNSFKEATGAGLANMGVSGCKKLIDDILNDGGGVLFIDEAYQLTSGNNPGGGSVLDYLLAEVENLRGKVVFILAGYNKQMESFYAHNPGLPSRFPIEMTFADYTDDELLRILELKMNKKYNGFMECEDGLRGLYCRIVARRIGRGRGKEGFGNARTVENNLDIISRRQADRIRRERKAGSKDTNDLYFTKEDLIGPEPEEALKKCEAWKKLQQLVGLTAVKEAVRSLVDSIQQNYKREIAEQPLIEYSLNKVFLGNPGTGKTTVAKLYGDILVALGLLSKGKVVVKNPSDFVGSHLGQSEQLTKGILAAAVGKVLVIDEAYGLYGGGGSQGSTSDPYKTAVIDTIVAEVQSVPGDDRCVLLLGYKDQMETMFQNVNPGLSRRFPISSGFTFDDFSDEELAKIVDLKLKQQGYQTTPQAKAVAMEMLKRARNRPHFGNAGEIDIILDATKARNQRRISKGQAKANSPLEPEDFDENHGRADNSKTNIRKLFEGTVGSEQIVKILEDYQETVRIFKSMDMDPKTNIPFNFLFRGPPGTGKTTTAKKMGKVFYDMGFLATTEVVECSATDLIGQFVGQTGPKVQSVLDKALGKVLFIDEAYRLAEGHFAKEAMDELVDSTTKPKYQKKLIIILAGYEADINRLMSVNPGLTSRFPTVIDFRGLTPDECIALLLQRLRREKDTIGSKGVVFDLDCLDSPTDKFRKELSIYFASLAGQDGWASARDVETIATAVFGTTLRSRGDSTESVLMLREVTIRDELQGMLNERMSRSKAASASPSSLSSGFQAALQQAMKSSPQTQAPPPPPTISTAAEPRLTRSQSQQKKANTANELLLAQAAGRPEAETDSTPASKRPRVKDSPRCIAMRDAGVSDAVWEQLQRDRQAEQEREEEYQRLLEEKKNAATDAAREKIVKRLLEEERRRKEEEAKRKKLAAMGACPVGYAWIKQAAGGWRCAGGSHYMGDADLERA
ncbi:P-loop containing nucleoside triphosphate hydrolase protein [Bombardia bombarda]|uniref:P-loop containing nucleoside triphosphate hydrolase protein n=1 Tax=Bombardia bombarda TaxID=252184 RepID=A0AA40CEH2_9PEZI|nr:P-loop containing nucleoside triphosphate hydrolase protein [Bombardia bombarda]